MIRKLLLVLALLVPFKVEAQEVAEPDSVTVAEFSWNTQLFTRMGEVRPWYYMQGYEYFRTKTSCGHWGWLFGARQYVAGVWGIFCDPRPWLSLGVALGGESFVSEAGENSVLGRWATTVWVGTEGTNLEVYFENGPSKISWYRAELNLLTKRYATLGGIVQSEDGAGPRLEMRLPLTERLDIRFSGAPMFSRGEVNSLFEARLFWTLREPE